MRIYKESSDIKISIILPIYNVETYLCEALDSILNQTIGIKKLQVIMVDDGSTDSSSKIIDDYAIKYDNFIAIHLDRASGAAGRPRNIGLEYAMGDYIMYLDPDDKYKNNACELLYNAAQNYDSDIVIGKFEKFTSKKSWVIGKYFDYELVNVKPEERREILELPPSVWTKIYKRDFLIKNNINYPEGVAAQDAVFNVETLLRSNKVTYIPQIVCNYRIREDENNPSITQNINFKYFKDYVSTRMMIIDLYKKYATINYFEKDYEKDLKYLITLFKESKINEFTQIVKLYDIISEFIILDNINLENVYDELILEFFRKKYFDKILELNKIINGNGNILISSNALKRYSNLCNELINTKSWRLTEGLRKIDLKLFFIKEKLRVESSLNKVLFQLDDKFFERYINTKKNINQHYEQCLIFLYNQMIIIMVENNKYLENVLNLVKQFVVICENIDYSKLNIYECLLTCYIRRSKYKESIAMLKNLARMNGGNEYKILYEKMVQSKYWKITRLLRKN